MRQQMFAVRESMVQLRRVVLPMREVVNTLMRRDVHLVSERLGANYPDAYDHALRAGEWTESLRDMLSTIFEAPVDAGPPPEQRDEEARRVR